MYIIYPIEFLLLIAAFVFLGLLGMEITTVAWIIAVVVVISTLLCWIGTFAFASESTASEMIGGIIMGILMSHMSYHLVRLLLTNSQVHGIDLLRGLLWLLWPV
ncbi:MAG: hypothetical protein Q4A07_00560 [Coriobacteriales bacterium]|nr:hypothetical protein [Coriobacteriales bacterium]